MNELPVQKPPRQRSEPHVYHQLSGLFLLNSRPARRILLSIFTLTPILLTLFYIKRYGVNVPYWDEWGFVMLIEKAYAGNLSLTDMFAQHNEHRIPFPKVFMLLLAGISHYNSLMEMYFDWLLMILGTVLIYKSYRRNFAPAKSTLWKFAPVTWLMFSWRQNENLLWAWQITFFMTAFAVVLTHYLLESSKTLDKYFFCAICGGIVASFSNSNGLLVWPIGLLQIWTSHQKIENDSDQWYRVNECVWVLIAACVYILYFIDYTKPLNHPSLLYFAREPISSLRYLLVVLGSPLGVKRGTAMAGGLLLAVIGILAYFMELKKSSRLIFSFWDSLMLFAFLSSLMLAVARSGFGVDQALSSRYTTFTILGIVALYIKSLDVFSARGKLNAAVLITLLCLIVQGVGVSFFNGVKQGKKTLTSRRTAVYLLRHVASQDDRQLSTFLFPDAQVVRQYAPFLVTHKLSVFSRGAAVP